MDIMRSEKGQAAVEFALVLPILLMLIFGIIDFGRILYTKNALTSLSQESARHMSIYYVSDGTNGTVLSTYVSAHPGTLATTAFKKSDNSSGIQISPTTITTGSEVNVTLTYKIYYITPFVNMIPGLTNPFYITSSSTFRAE
jgi:Flp pilus assembly protein TadG